MQTRLLLPVLAALLTATAISLAAEPALLGHPAMPGATLDGEAVKAVLLGKKMAIGGTRLVVIIAKTGAAQEAFLESHVGMTTSQFQNYWRRLFMTGGGSAPKIVETEAEACKLAAETPGAILVADTEHAAGLVVLTGK